MNIHDLTITSIETITAFDVVTGNYSFTLDELQSATISQEQESTEITGKAGRKLGTLKKNKAVKISGTNGLVSNGLMEVQTGSTFEKKVTEVLWTDYLTVNSNKASTTWVAVGTTGNEIEALYLKNSDGTQGKLLTQAVSASSDNFAYDPKTKELTFSNIENGTEVIVYYKRNISAYVHTNESDVYSGKRTLFIDAMAEDKCANIYRIQIYIPKADFSGEFSLEMGDSQTVHAFDAESLAGACGAGGALWTYTIFGANEQDSTTTSSGSDAQTPADPS